MSAVEIAGIVLIAAGPLGLAYGGFSYTKETHEAKIGSSHELSVTDKETGQRPGLGSRGCDRRPAVPSCAGKAGGRPMRPSQVALPGGYPTRRRTPPATSRPQIFGHQK